MGESVVVSDYDPEWPVIFERLRDRIRAALGSSAATIEHVGSTAVPGLAAKPVIDLDVIVSLEAEVSKVVDALRSLGYDPEGRSLEIPGLVALGWPSGEPRHHLYVVVEGSTLHRERIAFRDHLRSNPDDANWYGATKRRLAEELDTDWEAYSRAKGDIVEDILRIAGSSAP